MSCPSVDCNDGAWVVLLDQVSGTLGIIRVQRAELNSRPAPFRGRAANASAAQRLANRIFERSSARSDTGSDIDLQQQVNAALQVKPQADGLIRKPSRNTGIVNRRSTPPEVRRAICHSKGADQHDQRGLPFFIIEHGPRFAPLELALEQAAEQAATFVIFIRR